MNYPLIRWTYRRRRLIPIGSIDYQLIAGYFVLWIIWNFWSSSQQPEEEDIWNHIIPGNIIMLFGNYTYYVIQYFLMKNFHDIDRSRPTGVILFYLIGPAICVILNFVFKSTVEHSMCATF